MGAAERDLSSLADQLRGPGFRSGELLEVERIASAFLVQRDPYRSVRVHPEELSSFGACERPELDARERGGSLARSSAADNRAGT